jgi:rod shape-determining protein MreD
MKLLLSIIIIILLVILQSSLYPYLKVYNVFPNLILILVLILSILKGSKKSLVWVLFGGFLLDVYSFNNPLGTSILGLLLVSYLAYFFSQNIFKKTSIFSVILIGIGGTLIYKLFIILVLLIIGISFQLSYSQLIFQIFYNLVVLIPLFYLMKSRIK